VKRAAFIGAGTRLVYRSPNLPWSTALGSSTDGDTVMTYGLSAEELAAQEILALPERALLDYFGPITIVAPVQIVTALNLAFIYTGDVSGNVVVAQANDVAAYQDTDVYIVNDY